MTEQNSSSSNTPPAAAPKKAPTSGGIVSESGDLSGQVDFYGQGGAEAGADSNDPTADPSDSGELGGEQTDDGGDDGEGSTEEETESVEEGEGEESEGEDGGKDDAKEEPGDAEAEEGNKKKTSISFGGKDYDIPLEATVPVTVNGEVEEAPISELINAYSSKSSIRKEVEQAKAAKEEVAQHRKKVMRDIEKKEVKLLDDGFTVNKGRELLKKGLFEDALNEFFQHDPEVWDKFDTMMSGYYPKFAQLSEAERRSIQLDRKTKLMEKRHGLAQERANIEKEVEAFNGFKEQSCTNVGLQESDVEDAWDTIVDNANKGQYSKDQLEWLKNATPHQKWQTALSEAVAGKTRGKITEVIKSQFPKLENKVATIIAELEGKLAANYLIKATKEDIAKIVSREYNSGKPGEPGRKVGTTNSLRDKAQPRHKLGEAPTQEEGDDIYDQSGRDESSSGVWGGQFSR